MNIVVATPYKIANYGAILQAWALRRTVERLGHHVTYLNCRYMWPGIFGIKNLILSRSISSVKSKLQINRMLRRSFSEIGGFDETQQYDSVKQLIANPPPADCYLSGSDQILHPLYLSSRQRYIPVLLGFGNRNILRVMYGASFGTNDIDSLPVTSELIDMFRRIDTIGVRERSGLSLLQSRYGVKGEWTPDPTFLLKAEDYFSAFHIDCRPRGERYVCTYMLGWEGRELQRDLACSVAMKEYGIQSSVHHICGNLSVSEWLDEISHASCLVTNSFHGHCFSRIFGIPCKLLEFNGSDEWRNERNRDLEASFQKYSLADMSEIGISYIERALR